MYKQGDYIAFMTNQPEVHVNEMFGYNDLTEDDFEKTEYVGFILSVIDDKTCLVMTVRPYEGFRCIVEEADILHAVDKRELTSKEKVVKERTAFLAPNVYHCKTEAKGESLEEKCEVCVREAMACLFPQEDIVSLEFSDSNFLKVDLLSGLQELYDFFGVEGRDAELEEACSKFEELLNAMHFKEYYEVHVGVRENGTRYYCVAIDLKMEEVVVMRDIEERTRFFRSLGPDYDMVYQWKMKFTQDLLMKDQQDDLNG